MRKKCKNSFAISALSAFGLSLVIGVSLPGSVHANESSHSHVVIDSLEKKTSKAEAEKLLYQAPEATALTENGEKELNEHYVEKYMPVEGCSLVEELPKTSDINYVPPKPKVKKTTNTHLSQKKREQKTIKRVGKATSLKNPARHVKKQLVSPQSPTTQVASTDDAVDEAVIKGNPISMTPEEREWLEKLVEAESGGEPYEGRVAVATVIANRVEMDVFPNNVMDVITAKNQFSPFIDGSVHSKIPSAETKRAVTEVFDEGVRSLSSDTAYFCTTAIAPNSWIGKTRPFVKTIGNHSFYLK